MLVPLLKAYWYVQHGRVHEARYSTNERCLQDENGNVQDPETPRDGAADFGGPGGPAPPPPPPPPPPPEFKDDSIIHVHWDRLQKVSAWHQLIN